MSRTRTVLLAASFLIVFLAINRVDQILWQFYQDPRMFQVDTSGAFTGLPLVGSVGFSEPPDDPGRKSWPLDGVRYLDREIVVLTGTTFTCEGVPCRLLGVQDSSDPVKQKQAKEFARFWFDHCNSFRICNRRKPIVELGVSVVWIGYPSGDWSYLNQELVRAGLVTVNRAQKQAYEFDYFDGEELNAIDWKGGLALAEDDFAGGKISKLFTEWQEALSSSKTDPPSESDVMP